MIMEKHDHLDIAVRIRHGFLHMWSYFIYNICFLHLLGYLTNYPSIFRYVGLK